MSEKPFSKPYLDIDDKEYLDLYGRQTMEEGDPSNQTEYSEGQFPYSEDEGEFPAWEWTWPPLSPFPGVDWDFSSPDISGHPCSEEDSCTGAGIIGPDEISCNGGTGLGIYTQVHVFIGCAVAPAWAAFGSWAITETYDDAIVINSSSPISCTVEVPIGVVDGEIVLTYYGPLECQAEKRIKIDCGCCVGLTISGDNDTLNWQTYTVTLIPACPAAVGTIEWLAPVCVPVLGNIWADAPITHPNGSTVSVEFDSDNACGSFRLTVTDPGADCGAASDSIDVTIGASAAGGDWEHKVSGNPDCHGWPYDEDGIGPEMCRGDPAGIWGPDDFLSVTDVYLRYGANSISDCVSDIAQFCGACSQCDGNPGAQTYGGDCGCGDPPPAPAVPTLEIADCTGSPWPGSGVPGDCCWTAPAGGCSVRMFYYDICEWTCDCPP